MDRIGGIVVVAAVFSLASATQADTIEFSDAEVVVIASGAPDTSFVAGVNLPGVTTASIDNSTVDYGPKGVSEGLLSFNGFTLPSNATIQSATLNFYTKSATDGPVNFYQMSTAWNTSSTWNSLGGGLVVGTNTAASPAASANTISNGTPLSLDVTSMVQAWANGAANNGIGIIDTSGDGWDFQTTASSKDFSPYLTVEYSVTPVPLPAALPLMASALGLLGFGGRLRKRGKV